MPHDGHDAMPRLEPLGPTWPPRVHCWKCPRPRPQEWWYDIGQSVRWSDALRSETLGMIFGWDDGMMVFHLGEDLNLQLLKGGWIFRNLGKTFKNLGEGHEFGKNMNSTHENHECSSVNIFGRPHNWLFTVIGDQCVWPRQTKPSMFC